jgi:hypothetical protein
MPTRRGRSLCFNVDAELVGRGQDASPDGDTFGRLEQVRDPNT